MTHSTTPIVQYFIASTCTVDQNPSSDKLHQVQRFTPLSKIPALINFNNIMNAVIGMGVNTSNIRIL